MDCMPRITCCVSWSPILAPAATAVVNSVTRFEKLTLSCLFANPILLPEPAGLAKHLVTRDDQRYGDMFYGKSCKRLTIVSD